MDGNSQIDYVIEKRGIRHARINVNENFRVRLIVPNDFTEEDIESLKSKKSKWINENLSFFQKSIPEEIKLSTGEILFFGAPYSFIVSQDINDFSINHEKKEIITNIDLADEKILNSWYKDIVKEVLLERVDELAKKHNFNYNQVFIRDQKTKWGNCSKEKNLSFNWRLVKAPKLVQDYIIIHELLHTKILNHNRAFWLHLSMIMPEYEEAINWLLKHGKSL